MIFNFEILYRSIRADSEEYTYEAGKVHFTPSAFRDRSLEPSVDRALLRLSQPKKSRKSLTDGITALKVSEVKKIGEVKGPDNENKNITHIVKPKYKPILSKPRNISHAVISVSPQYMGKEKRQEKTFRLLRVALARQATINGWLVHPVEERKPKH